MPHTTIQSYLRNTCNVTFILDRKKRLNDNIGWYGRLLSKAICNGNPSFPVCKNLQKILFISVLLVILTVFISSPSELRKMGDVSFTSMVLLHTTAMNSTPQALYGKQSAIIKEQFCHIVVAVKLIPWPKLQKKFEVNTHYLLQKQNRHQRIVEIQHDSAGSKS